MIRSKLVIGTVVSMLVAVFAAEGCASKTSTDKKTSSSSTSPKTATKGSGQKGATAAKGAGQKTGSTATDNKDKAQDQGAEYEGATCDAELEGTAWCGDEHTAIFCSDGHWYALDCASIGGDLCAETTDSHVVDCEAPEEVGE